MREAGGVRGLHHGAPQLGGECEHGRRRERTRARFVGPTRSFGLDGGLTIERFVMLADG